MTDGPHRIHPHQSWLGDHLELEAEPGTILGHALEAGAAGELVPVALTREGLDELLERAGFLGEARRAAGNVHRRESGYLLLNPLELGVVGAPVNLDDEWP